MLRGHDAPEGGLVFFTPLNRRQRMSRRRLWGIGAIVGLALAGTAVGNLVQPDHRGREPAQGPLRYLPQ